MTGPATTGLDPAALVAQAEAAGCTTRLPAPPPGDQEEAHAENAEAARALRDRLVVSAVLAAPVVALSVVPGLQFTYWQWISLALAAPVVAWGAQPFHRAAWTSLRHGTATTDTLVSVVAVAAFGWSLYALLLGGAGAPGTTPLSAEGAGAPCLEVAAAVPVLVLAGRQVEARSRRRAGATLRALLDLGAKDVFVLRAGSEVRVPIDALAVGDRFVVRPGETIATDGEVEDGSSAIDTSMVTGEPAPVEVGPRDTVVGGCANAGGRLVVRATRAGSDTQLARTARLVEHARSGTAPVQRLADRVSGVVVPVVIALAVATLGFWLGAGGGAAQAITAALAVLVIACPCALGLATPTALLVGTGRAARLGILITGPDVLESTRRVDTVLLDKTGTVTTGVMEVRGIHTVDGIDADAALRLAGAVEQASEHPVGRAIAAAAEAATGALPGVAEFGSHPGRGVRGVVAEVTSGSDAAAEVVAHAVLVGRPVLLAEHDIVLPAELETALATAEAGGNTAVAVAWDGVARALVVVGDTVRPTSAEAVRRLRRLALSPMLLTGDSTPTARAVADIVGIGAEAVLAEVAPEDKVAVVRRLQGEGKIVAMVGDGVDDAAALAAADLGLAMGTGTDVAIEAAGDLVLMRGDLLSAVDAIRLSRRTLAVIRGNLVWASALTVAALPLAAGGLLDPLIAGAATAFSSVFVVINCLRLHRFRPTHR